MTARARPTSEPRPTAPAGTPRAEVEIDEGLVRVLLRRQHPDLAALPLRPLGAGWDNAMLRLGDDRLVRLPRRREAAVLVEHEQRWLPELAARLPLAVPAPVRAGAPDLGYPWRWSMDHPQHARMAERTLRRVLEDARADT